MQPRTRLVRRRAGSTAPLLTELLDAAVAAQTALADATRAASATSAALAAELRRQNRTEVRSGAWVGHFIRTRGRTTNFIDPKKFRDLVPDDKEFYSAISVSITTARGVLPAKTLNKIIVETPGKLGEERIEIKPVE